MLNVKTWTAVYILLCTWFQPYLICNALASRDNISLESDVVEKHKSGESNLRKLFKLVLEKNNRLKDDVTIQTSTLQDQIKSRKANYQVLDDGYERRKQGAENGINLDPKADISILMSSKVDGNKENVVQGHVTNNFTRPTVRVLRNKGTTLLSFTGVTLINLRFKSKNTINYGDLLNAVIHIAPFSSYPGNYGKSSLRFSVHHLRIRNWISLKSELKNLENLTTFESVENEVRSRIFGLLPHPLATRQLLYANGRIESQQERSLDLTSFFRGKLRHRNVTSRLVLAVTRDQRVFHPVEQRCLHNPTIRLVLVGPVRALSRFKRGADNKSRASLASDSLTSANLKNKYASTSGSNELKIFEATSPSRVARSVRSKVCQRRAMWVDFGELGWSDWVIAPRAFQAYRCGGECPYPLGGRLNSTNYAMLSTMMHSVDPGNSPMPCCVPTTLSAVSVLYLDTSNNVVLRNYEGMIVESCGCR